MRLSKDKYYRILHVPTGLYKTGGYNSKFSKVGKIWKGSALKAHLRMFDQYKSPDSLDVQVAKYWNVDPKDCLIIEYELDESNSQTLTVFVKDEME